MVLERTVLEDCNSGVIQWKYLWGFVCADLNGQEVAKFECNKDLWM
jgi:hypothetical protein